MLVASSCAGKNPEKKYIINFCNKNIDGVNLHNLKNRR